MQIDEIIKERGFKIKNQIMAPKEKAWEIFINHKNMPDKWKNGKIMQNYYAKYSSLFTIDQILKAVKGTVNEESGYNCEAYYEDVKKEIEKLKG